MLLGQVTLTFNLTIFWLVALGPTFAYAVSQRHLYPDWGQRMRHMPLLVLVGTGLALSNTLAIAQGLVRKAHVFRRTPKFCIERSGDRWFGNRYALAFEWLTLGELVLAAYALFTVGLAVTLGKYLAVPFLGLYVAGYGYVALHGLRDAWVNSRMGRGANSAELAVEGRGRGGPAPRSEFGMG
jgi:hypothetical protein